MPAEMLEPVKIVMTPELEAFLIEYKTESDKSPDDFKVWYDALPDHRRKFIDGLCMAASLGMNDDLFDMSKFEYHKKKLDKEYDFSDITLEGDEDD